MSRGLLIIIIGFLACGASRPHWSSMRHLQREQTLKAVMQKCGLRDNALQLNADDWVVMNFDPPQKYEKIDCALAELRRLKVKNMGFIGNEAYPSEKK